VEPLATLDATLDRFFDRTAPIERCGRVIVAFSGGPDSTALLVGLARLGGRRGFEPVAAHLDHGLDPGSADRAAAAVRLAAAAGVRCTVARREVAAARRGGESVEQAARRVRYGFLDEVRRAERARWTATAHHQARQAGDSGVCMPGRPSLRRG
jgi:tRNA(Ile)-lysidine synthase